MSAGNFAKALQGAIDAHFVGNGSAYLTVISVDCENTPGGFRGVDLHLDIEANSYPLVNSTMTKPGLNQFIAKLTLDLPSVELLKAVLGGDNVTQKSQADDVQVTVKASALPRYLLLGELTTYLDLAATESEFEISTLRGAKLAALIETFFQGVPPSFELLGMLPLPTSVFIIPNQMELQIAGPTPLKNIVSQTTLHTIWEEVRKSFPDLPEAAK